MNRKLRFLSDGGPSAALLMSLLAFGALTLTNYLRQSEPINHPEIRGDSLQYFRDGLFLQHRLFELPGTMEEYLTENFEKHNRRLPSQGIVDFIFGDKVIHSLLIATLLQAFDGNIRFIFLSNLIAVGLSFFLVVYCLTREFGIVAGVLGIVFGCLVSTGETIPTMLLEPNISLALTTLAFGAWMVLRGHCVRLGVVILAVACVMAMLLKSSLIPFAWMAALLCGVAITRRLWDRIKGSKPGRIPQLAGAVLAICLVQGAAFGVRQWTQGSLNLDPAAFERSNGPYAIWMGSLPTRWTGAYSGRITTQTFHFGGDERAEPEHRRQYDAHLDYFFPMHEAWRDILQNYVDYPLDALARVTFRYTRLMRTNGFENPAHATIGVLSILGCICIIATKRAPLLPWVIALQGIVWLHALSRYRGRDEEQCIALISLTSVVGVACLLKLATLPFRGRRPSAEISSTVTNASRSRLSQACQAIAIAILILPLALSFAVPGTQSIQPPRIDHVRCRLVPGDTPRLNVEARLDDQHQFARLNVSRGRETQMSLAQSDEDGRILFDVPADIERLDELTMSLDVWSLTGHESNYRVTDADYVTGD